MDKSSQQFKDITHHRGMMSFGQEELLQLQFLNEKKSRILSQMNWLICFQWAIGYVNYSIIPAMRQNILIPLLILILINNMRKDSAHVVCSRTYWLCQFGQ